MQNKELLKKISQESLTFFKKIKHNVFILYQELNKAYDKL